MGPSKAGRNRTARKPAAKLPAEALFEYAVKYLGFQACSGEALKSKLRLKAANLADIDATIARLKEIGYLNDARFRGKLRGQSRWKTMASADAGIERPARPAGFRQFLREKTG